MEKRREKQDMGLVFKMLSEKGPSEIFTTMASGTVRTRQATGTKNLVPKFARTDQRKFSFSLEQWKDGTGCLMM
jgi:hypothetical protein